MLSNKKKQQARRQGLFRTSNKIQGILHDHKIPCMIRIVKEEYYMGRYRPMSHLGKLPESEIREVFTILARLPGDDYKMSIRVEEEFKIKTAIWWHDTTHLEFSLARDYMYTYNKENHYNLAGFGLYIGAVLAETDGLLFEEYSHLIECIEIKNQLTEMCFLCQSVDQLACVCSTEKRKERDAILEKPLKEKLDKAFENSIRIVCGEGKKPNTDIERKQVDERNCKVKNAVGKMQHRVAEKYRRIRDWDDELDSREPSGYYQHALADNY